MRQVSTWVVAAVCGLAMGGVAVGQMAQPAQGSVGGQPAMAAPAPMWHTIVERDAAGKVKRIDQPLDFVAMGKNHTITAEDRAKITPTVKEWMEEIDTLAIDNLDFLEMIDRPDGKPGILDEADPTDMKQLHRMGQIMTALTAVGQMTTFLQNKGALNTQQAGINQSIINEYLQAVMNEIVAQHGGSGAGLTIEQQAAQAKAVTGFLYYMSCRDTLEAYRRLLASSAPVAGKAVKEIGLPSEVASKVAPLAEKAAGAKGEADQRRAARALMNELDFDQRRAFLKKARELNPPSDPLAGLPAVPTAPGR